MKYHSNLFEPRRKSRGLYSLIGITVLAILFHLLIVVQVIPYEITWGGRLKNVQEMYVFESVSILINVCFLHVLLQKARVVKNLFIRKNINKILWVFFAVFVLNTLVNLFAQSNFEKAFSLLTALNALLLWNVLKQHKYAKSKPNY